MNLADLTVNEYHLASPPPYGVVLRRKPQQDGTDKWAIQSGIFVLNKKGVFVMEPPPSARTGEWIAQHRFDTAEEALAAYEREFGKEAVTK